MTRKPGKFYVECRPRVVSGDPGPWKPVTALFGVGRWECDTPAEAEAELRIWTRTAKGELHDFRIERGTADKVKSENARKKEVKLEAKEAAARDVAADPDNLLAAIRWGKTVVERTTGRGGS